MVIQMLLELGVAIENPTGSRCSVKRRNHVHLESLRKTDKTLTKTLDSATLISILLDKLNLTFPPFDNGGF